MQTVNTLNTGCCDQFTPELWQEKEITFNDKLFIKEHVISAFHIPLNFGKVMERCITKVEKAKAVPKQQLVLTDETSPWGSDIYFAVDKTIPNTASTKLSGTFITKVYEGKYNLMGHFIDDIKQYVKSKDKEIKKLYFYYPYCPKCAKAYGKNYIVILAQV